MNPQATTGDVTLAARPATAETFASFGKLLAVGQNDMLGRRARVLISLSEARPGPRRVSQLTRYPEARRAIIVPSGSPMWLVVLGAGDGAAHPPAAFTIPAGAAVILNAGVWHAGPYVLEESVVTELLEAPSGADRMDRVAMRDLIGAEAARVILSDEPGAPAPGIDLTAPGAVMLDASLAGKLRVACLCFEDLLVARESPALDAELAEVAAGLRGMWSRVTDLAEVPGVGLIRGLYEGLAIDPARAAPPSEALLAGVLAGEPVPRANTLTDALTLSMLRMGVPMSAYDAGELAEQVLVRAGAAGEGYSAPRAGQVRLEGRPALCDRDGPFGSPVGDSDRALVRTSTRRALVTLFLSPSTDTKAAGALMEGVERVVVRHCAGQAVARLVVG